MHFPVNHQKAIDHLRQADLILAELIDHVGNCTLGQTAVRETLLTSLLRSIIYQRISTKAANTIYQRFLALFSGNLPTAEQIRDMPAETLRQIGLPAMKVVALKDVANHVLAGLPTMAELETMADADIIRCLTPIQGIGQWSVEMLLIFQLQRWDVLPVDDLGIRLAVQDRYGLTVKPSKQELIHLAKPWQPYRAIACWYLWRSRDLPQAKNKP